MSNPAIIHWNAGKRVLRYLKDADWGSQPHRHSISGFTFLVAGGAVSWSSRKQSLVAQSTAEVELIATSDAGRELLWYRALITELTTILTRPTVLYCDNQSAIKIAESGLLHARTKHIDIRFRFVHELITNNAAEPVYCHTTEMLADMFTKALPGHKLKPFIEKLGLRRLA
ncbi:hypothetical protein EUX98_g9508 [Antrodiella citrinella]|uniref:Reverse transcriptase Ty1/copia-type domain-containing protein n=1 Tax=Antrodiella citrinella TaxID=2447956 RepID=A0A4S4LS30_9APHY|nr:hypothetical protein EUX98_g9508 [Antrodiella citrinella]